MRSKDAQFNSKDCKITEIGCAIFLVKNLWFIMVYYTGKSTFGS